MSKDRLTRVNELLHREIGQGLYRVMKDYEADLASVTVTHVQTSSNLRTARVLVSVRADDATRERVLGHLKRHRRDFQDIIHRNVVLKYTPKLLFQLDRSIEQGDHVLDILREIEPTLSDGDEETPSPDGMLPGDDPAEWED